MTTRVVILEKTEKEYEAGHKLSFQKARWHYTNGSSEVGYRFMWWNPTVGNHGGYMAHRGQARIPDVPTAMNLIATAISEGCAAELPALKKEDDNNLKQL